MLRRSARCTPRPRWSPAAQPLLLVIALVAPFTAPVDAQSLELAAVLGATAPSVTGAAPPPTGTGGLMGGFEVAVAGVRSGGTTLGASLGYAAGGASTGVAQFGVSLSANETFGPLGNVIFELTGTLRTDAVGEAALAVRGTIGPIAARVRLSAFGADPAVFRVVDLAGDARPSLGGPGFGAELGVTARFGRNVILDAEPDLYLTGSGVAGRLEVRLRRLRTFADNELRVYVAGATVPGVGASPSREWHAAVGAGVLLPRGRAPDVELLAFVGSRGGGVLPGARISWAESFGGGVRLDASGSLEPYRVDVHPLRLAIGVEFPLTARTTAHVDAVAAALDPSRPAAVALRTAVTLPVDLR